MQKRKSFICLILVLALTLGTIPAYAEQLPADTPDDISVAAASATSEFDFSNEDDLDKYDQYEKQTRDDGLEYVHMAATKGIGGVEPEAIGFARYGAFLRNSSETQYDSFYNLKYTTKHVDLNVMTIYADRQVNFVVKNQAGTIVANNEGIKVSEDVDRFNVSIDNGHYVYYIEFDQKEIEEATFMIEFSTNSTTVQPHYSVWFGAPLMLKGTKSIGTALFMVNYPSSSASYSLTPGKYLPEESWISRVLVTNVKKSGMDKLSSGEISVGYPGGSTSQPKSLFIHDTFTFESYPSNLTAIPARGTYKLNLNGLRWGALSSGSRFQFQGDVSVEYLYPFGT